MTAIKAHAEVRGEKFSFSILTGVKDDNYLTGLDMASSVLSRSLESISSATNT